MDSVLSFLLSLLVETTEFCNSFKKDPRLHLPFCSCDTSLCVQLQIFSHSNILSKGLILRLYIAFISAIESLNLTRNL